MKLSSITLKNFRPYYGEHTVNFATSDERHVTVIHGVNGAGKTSLFAALNWCLYGDAFVEKHLGQIGKLVNRRALAESRTVETSVELRFTYQRLFDGPEVEFRAKRVIHSNLSAARNAQTDTVFSLEILKREFRGAEASNWISAIIPENVSVHFFFDGEKIDNFTKPERKKEIENAVRNVLRIEEVERGMKHLEDVAGDYRRLVNKHASGKLKALLSVRRTKQSAVDKFSANLRRLQSEVSLAKKQKRDIDMRLEEVEGLRKLVDDRKATETAREKLTHKKDDFQAKIRALANQAFIPLAKPAIDEAVKILGEIPRGVPDVLLNDLLEKMRCLCGRPIHDRSPEFQIIQNLLKQSLSSDVEHIARETLSELKVLQRTHVENIPTDLKSVVIAVQQLDQDLKEQKARLEEISRALEDFDHAEAHELEERRKKYERIVPELEGEIREMKGRMLEITKEIDKLDAKIKTEKDSNAKAEELKRYWKLADEAASAMKTIYNLFAEEMRGQVESEVGTIFKRLVWNGDRFETVRLSDNYELQVIDESGEDVLPELSAGQRQVLSLAFIAAMAKVAVQETIPQLKDEAFPIVMDTAFGRLSRRHRENITETMPNIAKQLILFVTDEELHGQTQANLEALIGAEYELKFNPQTQTTTIEAIHAERG